MSLKHVRRKLKRVRRNPDPRLSHTYRCRGCGKTIRAHWSSVAHRPIEIELYKKRLCPRCAGVKLP